jgi:histidinol-phosphate/aromatic aminotransferase/cobyric acid decarboxylase-like protein
MDDRSRLRIARDALEAAKVARDQAQVEESRLAFSVLTAPATEVPRLVREHLEAAATLRRAVTAYELQLQAWARIAVDNGEKRRVS